VTELQATVVVVNWNGERLLRGCLDALARQQTSVRFQTWVVDNASTDGSVALLEQEYPDVCVLRNGRNLGFAGGNNTALREVTTPYAVLLNNDATPDARWLDELLAPFAQPGAERLAAVTSKVVFAPRFLRLRLDVPGFSPGGADERALGVRLHEVRVEDVDVTGELLVERLAWGFEGSGAGRFRWTRPAGELLVPLPDGHPGGAVTLPVTAQAEHVLFEVPASATAHDVVNNAGSVVTTAGYGADRGYQEVDEGQYDAPDDVFALCGCAVALRTDVGRSVDWFDDRFFLYYEDTDLSWRLRAAGWSIRYQPTAVVRHVHAASSVEGSARFVFHTDRNRLLMLVKNATAALALREGLRYPLTTGSMALRTMRQSLPQRSRPPLRPTLLRLRVLLSFLRLLPAALADRRRSTATAAVGRTELQQWLVTHR
jgi:GT2 family glycosyltransferase